MENIRKIAIICSGGDSQGMNTCIKTVVNVCSVHNIKVVAFNRGYQGLIENDVMDLDNAMVENIGHLGGCYIKVARSVEFTTEEGKAKAFANIEKNNIDGVILIGGNGSFRGAIEFVKAGIPIIGIPGTIDNDLYYTDRTLGFDTAVNNAVSAIDKLRDTADSHNLVFFVEVMGRDAGFIALNTAIATGAEDALIPETPTDIEKLCDYLEFERRNNKTSGVVIVAEGEELGGAADIARLVKERLPHYEARVTTLGHIQRGGSPTCKDRVLASVLGCEAVNALLKGISGVMVGQMQNKTVYTPFAEACSRHNEIDFKWYEIAKILSI